MKKAWPWSHYSSAAPGKPQCLFPPKHSYPSSFLRCWSWWVLIKPNQPAGEKAPAKHVCVSAVSSFLPAPRASETFFSLISFLRFEAAGRVGRVDPKPPNCRRVFQPLIRFQRCVFETLKGSSFVENATFNDSCSCEERIRSHSVRQWGSLCGRHLNRCLSLSLGSLQTKYKANG